MAANIPILILLLVGVGLLVFEMYIPGFGVPGISGIVTLALGFMLLRPGPMEGLLLLVILAAVLCAALVICLVTASSGRLAKSKLALRDVAIKPEDLSENALSGYLNRVGVAHTELRPSGIGDFDGARVNVVSDGEFIERGASIRVQSVAGNRVVVARA